MFICPASLPGEACYARVWHVLFAQTPSLWGMACLFFLPGEVCGAGDWHVYSLYLPPYRGLSRQGLACLVNLHPYLESPVALRFDMFIRPSSHIERPILPVSDMFFHPASLPTEACRAGVLAKFICTSYLPIEAYHAGVWHGYSPFLLTYTGLLRLYLSSLFALCPYLQRHVT